jgi:hypothetical protein
MKFPKKLKSRDQLVTKLDVLEIIHNYFPDSVREACKVAIAHPITQVSVERLFSALVFLTPDRRASLTPDIIDDMLFLRMNHLYV